MIKHRVVLLGNQGTGKTTFFNKITGSKEETRYEGESCTRQIIQGNSLCQLGFEVVDTPGFNSRVEKLVHIAGILAALTYGRVDRILIIVKFGRHDDMLDQLDRVFKPVKRFNDLVTIILTHWDLSKDKERDSKNVQELMQKKQITSIIFFSQNDEYYDICKTIGNILLNHPNEKCVKLLESEIYGYFDFLELEPAVEDQVEDHRVQVQRDFRKVANNYKKFILNLNDQLPHFQDILHQATIQIRDEANYCVEQFIKQNGDQIEQLVDKNKKQIHYLHYISLKKEIWTDLQSVAKLAQERMTKQQQHFYNFMRKCNHCGQIWLKVIGCDGETFCGKRVYSNFDKLFDQVAEKRVKIIKNEKNEINYEIKEKDQLIEDSLSIFIKESLEAIGVQYSQQQKIFVKKLLIRELGAEFKNFLDDNIFQSKYGQQITAFQTRWLTEMIYRSFFEAAHESDFLSYQQDFSNLLSRKKKVDGLGCGETITWSEMPLLSNSEIEALLSPELMEYFADQEQLRKEDTEFLNREYKQLINMEIQDQQKQIKIIQPNSKNQNQEQQVVA